MRTLHLPLTAIALLAGTALAPAAELFPPDKPIEAAIDHYLDAKLKEAGVAPASPADDANLLRRAMLDLVGRPPTVVETKAYLASTDPAKFAKLVDRLLASPGYVRHQTTEFDTMLKPISNNRGGNDGLRAYLAQAFADGRPWDRIFRELMLPDEKATGQKGSSEFLRQRVRDIDQLTTDVSMLFFGVNVSCAKCHDHPLVHDWKMGHYYGMKSFFAPTVQAGNAVAERDPVAVRFLTTAGQEHVAKMMFLTGEVVYDPVANGAPPAGKPVKKPLPAPVAPPKFSARAKLVEVAMRPAGREFFARSIVNRLWDRFYGIGLVTPVDQMHSANPPSHPELLRWLARDLDAHGYDLRRFVRGLVLSKAYARTSRWEGGGSAPDGRLFALAAVRPLTPMQLATSLRLATTDPMSFPPDAKPADFEKRMESLESSARGYASLFEQPREGFRVGVAEALLFSNNERIAKDFLADGGDRLVGRLKQIADPNEVVDVAVRAVLARSPREEEVKLLGDYLKQRSDRPVEARRQIVWALLTGSEFRFNY